MFTPYDPPFYGIFWGAYFLLIWGVGVVKIIFIPGPRFCESCDSRFAIPCRYGELNVMEILGKRKHTPPCSSAELFFAERNGGHREKMSVVDMAFLVFIGCSYPTGLNVFLWGQRSSQKIFFAVMVMCAFPHEWPFKLQKWAFRSFKTRSLRGWDL